MNKPKQFLYVLNANAYQVCLQFEGIYKFYLYIFDENNAFLKAN